MLSFKSYPARFSRATVVFQHIILSVVIYSFFAHAAWAATLKLRSGIEVKGEIKERTEEYVKMDVSGVVLTFYHDEIVSVIEEMQPAQPLTTPKEGPPAIGSSSQLDVFKHVAPAVVKVRAGKDGQYTAGSGFIIDKGLVITNFHVVVSAESIEVRLRDDRKFQVIGITAYDPIKDICILKIDGKDLPTLTLGDSDKLVPEDPVIIMGMPPGKEYTLSEGVFSVRRRICGVNKLQTTAAITPGSSGGPVLNKNFEVIGVATLKRIDANNYSFAIPINEVKAILTDEIKMTVAEFRSGVSMAYVYYHQGQKNYFEGNIDLGIENMKRALEVDPTYTEALMGLGELYTDAGRAAEAIDVWQKVLAVEPDDVEAHTNLGNVYAQQGKYDEALEEFSKALEIDPQSVETLDNQGAVYSRKKMYREAISSHEQAIKNNAHYAQAYYNLAATYYNLKEYDQAERYCQEALSLKYKVPASFLEMLRAVGKNPTP